MQDNTISHQGTIKLSNSRFASLFNLSISALHIDKIFFFKSQLICIILIENPPFNKTNTASISQSYTAASWCYIPTVDSKKTKLHPECLFPPGFVEAYRP